MDATDAMIIKALIERNSGQDMPPHVLEHDPMPVGVAVEDAEGGGVAPAPVDAVVEVDLTPPDKQKAAKPPGGVRSAILEAIAAARK